MFRYRNSFTRRIQSQFPQPEEVSLDFYQNTHQFGYFDSEQNSGMQRVYNGFDSDCGGNFPEDIGRTKLQERGEEEEAVDELLQILIECLKKADIKTREFLLRKFFIEIEKEKPMERFIVEKIKHSKTNLISVLLKNISSRSQDSDVFVGRDNRSAETEAIDSLKMRDFDGSYGEESSLRLERFKVRTVNVGDVVKEEESN